jgi:hypothetical protein
MMLFKISVAPGKTSLFQRGKNRYRFLIFSSHLKSMCETVAGKIRYNGLVTI